MAQAIDPPPVPGQNDSRPLVGRPVTNRGIWLFGAALAIAAIGLFTALETRRSAVTTSATAPSPDYGPGLIAAPPAPTIPFDAAGQPYPPDRAVRPFAKMVPPPRSTPFVMPGVPTAPRVFQPGFVPGPPMAPPQSYGSQMPPDASYRPPPAATTDPVGEEAQPGSPARSRVRAVRFANPETTVPQGALLHAVLETALDSNRPGFARAVISRDVRGFDGSRVLIPRGSRLFGEYKSDLSQGQNRAFIQWQRLTRPDGVQIAIDSPAADPLGRAGVRGKVNDHFFTRFGSAILQSTLDIGVGLATSRASRGAVVLGMPGGFQSQSPSDTIRPTLTVRQGTSVSVFVAKDLDFTTVEQ